MISILKSLGVKKLERRSVIFVVIGIFIVGNMVWILPATWGSGPELMEVMKDRDELREKNNSKRLEGIEVKLKNSKTELKSLKYMENTKSVSGEDHARKLMSMVEQTAERVGLILKTSRGSTSRRKKFDEYKRMIKFECNMIQLVSFLKRVSEEQSMIRVSDMKIFPTPNRQLLQVDLTFVASFQKKEPNTK
jgi:hypothetical protein